MNTCVVDFNQLVRSTDWINKTVTPPPSDKQIVDKKHITAIIYT